MRCRSAATSQRCGGARPVSDSFTPIFSLTDACFSLIDFSNCFRAREYGAALYVLRTWISLWCLSAHAGHSDSCNSLVGQRCDLLLLILIVCELLLVLLPVGACRRRHDGDCDAVVTRPVGGLDAVAIARWCLSLMTVPELLTSSELVLMVVAVSVVVAVQVV